MMKDLITAHHKQHLVAHMPTIDLGNKKRKKEDRITKVIWNLTFILTFNNVLIHFCIVLVPSLRVLWVFNNFHKKFLFINEMW